MSALPAVSGPRVVADWMVLCMMTDPVMLRQLGEVRRTAYPAFHPIRAFGRYLFVGDQFGSWWCDGAHLAEICRDLPTWRLVDAERDAEAVGDWVRAIAPAGCWTDPEAGGAETMPAELARHVRQLLSIDLYSSETN